MMCQRLRLSASVLLRYLAGLVLTFSIIPVHAQQPDAYQTLSADDLLGGFMDGRLASWIKDPAQRNALSTFMGTSYILGVADSVKGEMWCPKNVRMEPFTGAVMDYLADLPEARQSENAAKIVAEALSKAYPCSQ